MIQPSDDKAARSGSRICIFYAYLSVFHPPVLYHQLSAGSDNVSPAAVGPTEQPFVDNNLSALELFPWATPNPFFFKSQKLPKQKLIEN
jgi:hypothetical protein